MLCCEKISMSFYQNILSIIWPIESALPVSEVYLWFSRFSWENAGVTHRSGHMGSLYLTNCSGVNYLTQVGTIITCYYHL